MFAYLYNLWQGTNNKNDSDESFDIPPTKLPAEVFKAHIREGKLIKTDVNKVFLTKKEAFEMCVILNSFEPKVNGKEPNYTIEREQKDGVCNGGHYVVRTYAQKQKLKEFTSALLQLPEGAHITLSLQWGNVSYFPSFRGRMDKPPINFPGPSLDQVYYECEATLSFSNSSSHEFHELELLLLERGNVYESGNWYIRSPAFAHQRPLNYCPDWVDKDLVKKAFGIGQQLDVAPLPTLTPHRMK